MEAKHNHKWRLMITTVVVLLMVTGSLADKQSFDCKMRKMAMDFAHKIQPFRSEQYFKEIADALNGAKEAQNCNVSVPDFKIGENTNKRPPPAFPIPNTGSVFYVDAKKGSNANSGTKDSPFETITKAIFSARAAGQYSTIVLREGTFYQPEEVVLTSSDKGLTIQNYPNEEVWISGGKVITPQWEKYDVDPSKKTNIYKATFSKNVTFVSISGLRVNNKRTIRARYPNADPELGFGSNLIAEKWLPPTLPDKPDKEINPSQPFRNSSQSFTKFDLGIGGPCKNFNPPAGYWCATNIGGGGAHVYKIPSGMVATKKTLPNSPYKNPIGAVVQTWRPGHWASWMFEVGSYDAKTGIFTFDKGGFQGARGNEKGDEIVVENVMEELDAPNEWFYNTDSRTLYFFYNATSGTEPPSDTLFVITSQKTLIMAQGNMTDPVEDITIRGVNFRDTAYTYMDPHGMPSGGDWALERMGAVFLEGTKNVTIDGCIFERLDGNAIMVSGYNRNTTITRNEFAWLGSTAIAQWGYTKTVDESAPGMGWDGTDGNQPRFSNISYNFAHELGIWEKQSSFYTQAKSCQSLITNNIFFNGPRAGINFNDGFGGASTVTQNLLFNTCRESGEHGPFNSWDRQVYVTKVRDGTPSPEKDWDYIVANFMIANYNSVLGVDNDDGSAYYKTHSNFVAYSGTHPLFGGMKNDFGGHDNHHYNNIYAYVISGFGINSQLPGHEDYFYNNTVVMTRDGDYGQGTCEGPGKTVVHDNHIYSPTGKITECKMSLAEWQAKGNDPGTTASTWPSDEELEGMGRWLMNI